MNQQHVRTLIVTPFNELMRKNKLFTGWICFDTVESEKFWYSYYLVDIPHVIEILPDPYIFQVARRGFE